MPDYLKRWIVTIHAEDDTVFEMYLTDAEADGIKKLSRLSLDNNPGYGGTVEIENV